VEYDDVTTWRPRYDRAASSGKVVRARGLSASPRYLDVCVRAFFDTNLVAAEAGGLGLRACVVVAGFLDAQAPETSISESKDGVPILGPFALLNAGCALITRRRASDSVVKQRPPWL